MQRTTLSLEDDVARRVRRRAADERKSVAATVNELLRRALREDRSEAPTRRVRIKTFDVGAVLVDVNDRDALDALMGGEP